MTDRPIIFSAPMVRALLDGRKNQTRRVLKPQPMASGYYGGDLRIEQVYHPDSQDPDSYARFSADAVGGGAIIEETIKLPYAIGDRLYVREAHAFDGPLVRYYATDDVHELRRKRPSIHMPRWTSRLTLTVTNVRVQRLQEISDADAVAEGIGHSYSLLSADLWQDYRQAAGAWLTEPRESFRTLWNSLHGPDAWAANPWVVALSFTVQRGNIDQIGGAA